MSRDIDTALLDPHRVLERGRGAYWQFNAGERSRSPFAGASVYLDASRSPGMELLLAATVPWFIPDGVTRLSARQVEDLRERLEEASRMPDEPAAAGHAELARWLAAQAGQEVFVQLQRFA